MRMSFRREAERSRKQRGAARGALTMAALFALGVPGAQAQTVVDASNWGRLAAPVYGATQKTGPYAGAELFAGPNQFDNDYFHGVLPNGKIVRPAGKTVQIGENPLGIAVTPDGKYVITSSNDERNVGTASLLNGTGLNPTAITGGYALTVTNAATMQVVSHLLLPTNDLFVGLQVASAPGGGYTVYASGGGDNNVKVYALSPSGTLTAGRVVPIAPITPQSAGFASNYVVDTTSFKQGDYPTPTGNTGISQFAPTATAGYQTTFPAGMALSPNGRYLYVACNGDNSLAVIDTTVTDPTKAVIKQIPVGYLPYGVSVSADGTKVLVSNWGIQQYKFLSPTYSPSGKLTALGGVTPGQDTGGLFYVPDASSSHGSVSTGGSNPQTSSVSVVSVPGGDPTQAKVLGALYQGHALDALYNVGDTHPSATAIVRKGALEVEYVAKANSDSLGVIQVSNNRALPDVNLSPLNVTLSDGHQVHGSYPNALAVSPDATRLYVAEAGLDSVAVLDITSPTAPRLLGRIPTSWYPTALAVSPDGGTLYIANAKGVGEDINPAINNGTPANSNPTASGVESHVNSNYLFGTLQQVPVAALTPAALAQGNATVLGYNYTVNAAPDTGVVPVGGAASPKIKHVFFILHENKTFDSMLGNLSGHFGPFASLTFNNANGAATPGSESGAPAGTEFTALSLNTQALALAFATGANYYSDSEESDAGHQFSASGTASDYTEKTLLVKNQRGLLVNKNFEPEDYPEGGYIFNNAARNGVTFKDYGALIRVDGTDNGYSANGTNPDGSPTSSQTIDPPSGKNGYSTYPTDPNNPTALVSGVTEVAGSDVTSPTVGLGQSYFLHNPILAVLGQTNPNGEAHLDKNYPGYNFDISDQRRAREFIKDFDRMAKAGTLPTFLYIYQPNDHTGTGPNAISSPNIPNATGAEEVSDGDTGLGAVVQHLMTATDANGHSLYYNDPTVKGTDGQFGDGTGSAIFITYDDAQSGRDHIDPHRTPLIVVSPYARVSATPTAPATTGYVATRHYVTASIVKTEELLLGLPPNNYGDLFATDLRDLFQPTYNGVTANMIPFNTAPYVATAAGRKVWMLAKKLDSSGPDRDSARLGALTSLSLRADVLYRTAAKRHHLKTAAYRGMQAKVYQAALKVVGSPAPRDADD